MLARREAGGFLVKRGDFEAFLPNGSFLVVRCCAPRCRHNNPIGATKEVLPVA